MSIYNPSPTPDLSAYLKLDQTTPQTTVGTFTFRNIVVSSVVQTDLLNGIADNSNYLSYDDITGALKIGDPDYFYNGTRLTISQVAGVGITANSKFTASSLVKSGGTSSQFLKADGSVDSTAYAPTSTYVPYTGATTNVDLGTHNLTTTGLGTFGSMLVGTVGLSSSYRFSVSGTAATDAMSADIGVNLNQVAYPSTAGCLTTALVAGGSNLEIGTYKYIVTYTTALGETQAYSGAEYRNSYIEPAGITVTTDAGNRKVLVTIPVSPDYRVTGRKIYRTKVGGALSVVFLLVNVTNNVTTTYTDDIADGSLTGVQGAGYLRGNTTNKFITLNGDKLMGFDYAFTTLGKFAGNALTTGYNFTAVGHNAGMSVTSGANNTCIGDSAGASITTGVENTTVGQFAMYYGTGNYNTAIGRLALFTKTSGSNNTALGYYAGAANVNTSNGVFLGSQAGQYETAGNKLFIDSLDRTNEAGGRAKSLIYGVFATTVNAQTLNINGVFFPLASTTAAAPAYALGGMYFDTTLNKLRIGGATTWETVTSI